MFWKVITLRLPSAVNQWEGVKNH